MSFLTQAMQEIERLEAQIKGLRAYVQACKATRAEPETHIVVPSLQDTPVTAELEKPPVVKVRNNGAARIRRKDKALALRREGRSINSIAKELGVTWKTARDWANPLPLELEAAKKAKKERQCLKCDQAFLSHGPENRLCPACAQASADELDLEPHRVSKTPARFNED